MPSLFPLWIIVAYENISKGTGGLEYDDRVLEQNDGIVAGIRRYEMFYKIFLADGFIFPFRCELDVLTLRKLSRNVDRAWK
jgi:hypothetical protein